MITQTKTGRMHCKESEDHELTAVTVRGVVQPFLKHGKHSQSTQSHNKPQQHLRTCGISMAPPETHALELGHKQHAHARAAASQPEIRMIPDNQFV
eukprot:1158063-Pelagomonas_calceolata.AAC.3